MRRRGDRLSAGLHRPNARHLGQLGPRLVAPDSGWRGLSPAEIGLLAALAAWVLVPIVPLLLRPLAHGGVFTGVTGIDPYDEFQYLAWIRDTGTHGLSANLFGMTGGSHVFLQPMWFISGILWRLGAGLQTSYLIWSPIAVAVLWAGFALFARRTGSSSARRAAILGLGLFFTSPIGWLQLPLTSWVEKMQVGLTDSSVALQPWFAVHTAIALGVMPMVLLGCERLRASPDPLAYRSRLALGTAVGAAIVSWVHSWQGATLLLIMLGLTLTRRPRRGDLTLLLPIAACALPLLYQWRLTRTDAAWQLAERLNDRPDLIAVTPELAVLGPLLAVAIFGLIRRRPRDEIGWMLVLWPLAALAVYRFDPEFPPHALQGVVLPLAALAVRGWPSRRIAVGVGLAGILAFTIPGLINLAKGLPSAIRGNQTLFFQTANEHAALTFLAHGPPGAVIAPMPLALEVPAFTDRQVWDGHQTWTPDPTRPAQAAAFFGGAMAAAQARAFVLGTGVRWVLADCPTAEATLALLSPVLQHVRRFGCVAVAELK
jgi:hypothetical protein